MKNNLLTINDAAKIIRVSTARVRFLCKNGKITASKHGREWVIFSGDLDKYLEGKKMNDSEQYGLAKWDSSKTSVKNIEVPEYDWRDRVAKMDEMIAKEEPESLLKLTEL